MKEQAPCPLPVTHYLGALPTTVWAPCLAPPPSAGLPDACPPWSPPPPLLSFSRPSLSHIPCSCLSLLLYLEVGRGARQGLHVDAPLGGVQAESVQGALL